MSDTKISAGLAALKVMEGWGIDTMYGIPSGTLSGLMNAMGNPENNIKFIQVKHEEIGAMAAVMQYKFDAPEQYQALADVIAYAKDEEKTEREFYAVSSTKI